MGDKLLEWVKVLGPIVFSWPLVTVLIIIFFRKPLIVLMKKFTETPESSMKVGPVEFQLGKRIIPEMNAEHVTQEDYVKVDLSEAIGEIRNQGREATIVGFTVAYAMQASIFQKSGTRVNLSPRGIYVTAQKYDEWARRPHEGTSLGAAIKAMQKVGAYLESDWPYAAKTEPSTKKGPSYKISSFKELLNVDEITDAILSSNVVITAIKWTRDFQIPDANGRIVIRRSNSSEFIGAGTICLVGYDAESAEFKFALSWGNKWGRNGFGFIRNTDLSQLLVEAYIVIV